jgi:SAM-dependent methyltransferase
LSDLQGRCAHLEGCDVDPVVLDNPHLDGARQIEIGAPLPYPDESFDLIVSRWVFEHVDQPQQVADELLRVLRPGGWICALTPNAWGYLAFASRMVPNRLHVRVLRYVQPGRKPEDVFPTRYRMNSMRALKRLFGGRAEIFLTRTSAEPAYHFDNWLVFAFFKLLHKLLPAVSQTTLNIFIRKAGAR